jgi:predicted RNA-binding protein (virulence factor B family)
MIYNNQIFRPISLGERTTAYVVKATEERRIDLSLQQRGYSQVKDSAEQLYEAIATAGGFLELTDNSSPEDIQQRLHMSKKLFKRSVGVLMSHNRVVVLENGIKIVKK